MLIRVGDGAFVTLHASVSTIPRRVPVMLGFGVGATVSVAVGVALCVAVTINGVWVGCSVFVAFGVGVRSGRGVTRVELQAVSRNNNNNAQVISFLYMIFIANGLR